jgi:hypothetical protein
MDAETEGKVNKLIEKARELYQLGLRAKCSEKMLEAGLLIEKAENVDATTAFKMITRRFEENQIGNTNGATLDFANNE